MERELLHLSTKIDELISSNADGHQKLFNHVDKMKESISNIKIDSVKQEANLIERLDKKYAPVWTKQVIVWTMSVVGGAVLLAMVGSVLIPRVQAFF
jgi:hypothetical protein